MEHRKMLIVNDINKINENYRDILTLDPSIYYERIEHRIKPYQRFQSISIVELFPQKEDGTCACGCGVLLKGRNRRWATKECQKLPLQILYVLKGDSKFIANILYNVYGLVCSVCGKHSNELKRPNEKDYRSPIELEHTIPIKHGGGGGWLGNYTFHCFKCHREKTNKDFGFKKPK